MKLKNFTLLLLAAILSVNTFSQPTITKQKDIGGNADDEFTCMDLTKDGGLITGGYSYSNKSGQKTEDRKGMDDYWIVKMDSLQHIEWDKTIGGHSNDYLKSIQQTNDGGYILGGYSYSDSSGDKTQDSKGEYDYWVVKLNSSGDIQWDKTIGGKSDDMLASLQQTTDGGYILGGTSFSNISGNKTENSKGIDDYWVVKLSGSGHIQWDKTIGGKSDDMLALIQQTIDGGYILAGNSASGISGDKTEHGKGSYDYWVVKLDEVGNVQWDKTIGGNRYDFLESGQQTSDNGFILGGYSKSDISYDKTENSKGYYDYWVVKLNSLGHVQWDKTIGGADYDFLNSIQQTKDDEYILGGLSYSDKSGDKTENTKGGADYWIVKLDKKGVIQWDKTIGGSNNDLLASIKENRKNHYVLGGYSKSPVSGDKTQSLRGGSADDYWIVYLDYIQDNTTNLISSVNRNSLQNVTTTTHNNFFAYPNPVKDILYVQSKSKTIFSLTDQSGKILLTRTIEGNGEINIADLTPGIYYLKNNETGLSQKIIVAR